MAKKPEKKKDIPTTGHSWDGIEEYDNPMPLWWLWSLYACIVFAVVYVILYPAWPLVNGATPGLLGWSTRADVAADIAEVNARNEAINTKLAAADLSLIEADVELNTYAVNAGGAVFLTWCAQCHGSGAAGAKGYPNLLDDDWLWGGDIAEIKTTITHGIRTEDDDDARFSEMPAFGRDELLEKEEIAQVVNFVMSLSGDAADASMVEAGAVVFEDNCASCHAEDGSGDRDQGAPNLKDAIWLYGGDHDALTATVTNARYGVMPNWNTRLTDAQINAVAVYVHQLGGGE